MAKCPDCGAKVPRRAVACPGCGVPLNGAGALAPAAVHGEEPDADPAAEEQVQTALTDAEPAESDAAPVAVPAPAATAAVSAPPQATPGLIAAAPPAPKTEKPSRGFFAKVLFGFRLAVWILVLAAVLATGGLLYAWQYLNPREEPDAAPPVVLSAPRPEKLLFVSNRDGKGTLNIYTMNPDGSGQANLTNSDAIEFDPVWSPDRRQIAFAALTSLDQMASDIYVMQADGAERRRLSQHPANTLAFAPRWSPGGKRIAFSAIHLEGERTYSLHVMDADGGNLKQVGEGAQVAPAWSRDGRQLLVTSFAEGGLGDEARLAVMDADGGKATALGEGQSLLGVWSPDGVRIAYLAPVEDGDRVQTDLFVMNADGSQPVRLTETPELEFGLHWSLDGRRILFTRAPLYRGRRANNARAEVFAIGADGTELVQLTSNDTIDLTGSGDPEAFVELLRIVPRSRPGAPPEDPSLANLRHLGTALSTCIGDQDGRLPSMDDALTLRQTLILYLRNHRFFVHPDTREPYQPNASLSRRKLAEIDNPAETAAVYEASSAPDGTRGVLFLDGRARRMPEAAWARLMQASEPPPQTSSRPTRRAPSPTGPTPGQPQPAPPPGQPPPVGTPGRP